MSTIRPFKGIRPAADLAASIAALPYDVYNSSEAREIVRGKSPVIFKDRPCGNTSAGRY